jgi:hypothetical protein
VSTHAPPEGQSFRRFAIAKASHASHQLITPPFASPTRFMSHFLPETLATILLEYRFRPAVMAHPRNRPASTHSAYSEPQGPETSTSTIQPENSLAELPGPSISLACEARSLRMRYTSGILCNLHWKESGEASSLQATLFLPSITFHVTSYF